MVLSHSNPFSILEVPSTPSPPERKPDDSVNIKHRLDLRDTHSVSVVPRHTPIDTLESLPAVTDLQEVFGGSIDISPARSATSDTEVRVTHSLQELVSQITQAVRAEVKGEVQRAVDEKLASKFDDVDEGLRWVYYYHGIRNIEDFCLKRMRNVLNISSKTDMTYSEIVDLFHAKCNYAGVSKSDVMSLKDSKSRTAANTIFHLDVNSDDEVSRMWRLMQPTFREDAERRRYERLLQFGRSRTAISKKVE
jgi:hypothetical protein